MSGIVRRALVLVTVVVAGGWIVSGCSTSSDKDAVGTSGQTDPALLAVRVTSPFITVEVENHTGEALVKMDLSIKAGALQYVASVPRLENNDKRVVMLSEFRGSRDGGAMNPNLVTPKEVVVTASNIEGKNFQVKTPWKK